MAQIEVLKTIQDWLAWGVHSLQTPKVTDLLQGDQPEIPGRIWVR